MDFDNKEIKLHFERFRNTFGQAAQRRIMGTVGAKLGEKGMSYATEYPEPSGKPLPKFYTRTSVAGRPTRPYLSKFKSDKQAYYVIFILGKEGKIPYRRSGGLGGSMTSKVENVMPTAVDVVVGTNKDYAPYVIGKDKQSHYHAGNWMTLEENISSHSKELSTYAFAVFVTEVEGSLKP
jgi:phage gpG-like protein